MPVRPLRFVGDPVLAEVAHPIVRFDADLAGLVTDLFDTMYDALGRGLAAPQLGVLDRVFVTDISWKEGEKTPMVFVNPEIMNASAEHQRGSEACLSIPDRSFDVLRPTWVDMRWVDVDGSPQIGRFEGIMAVCVCHELDHLDGVLITESGTEI